MDVGGEQNHNIRGLYRVGVWCVDFKLSNYFVIEVFAEEFSYSLLILYFCTIKLMQLSVSSFHTYYVLIRSHILVQTEIIRSLVKENK